MSSEVPPDPHALAKYKPDPYPFILAWLDEQCRANKWVAMLMFLVVLSGGTIYAMAARLLGPSSAGKSFLAELVLKLFPGANIWTASRVTRASLFAIKSMKGLVLDEFKAAADVLAVIRELISKGRCVQYVATFNFELVPLVVEGPVAIVDLQLDGVAADFQDANRVIAVNVDCSDEQIRFHAKCAADAQSSDALEKAKKATQFAAACRAYVAKLGLTDQSRVVLEQGRRLVPPTGTLPVQFSRRVTQVRNLASTIALLCRHQRQVTADGRVIAEDIDIDRALEILNHSAVSEDRESNTGSDIHFFKIVFIVLKEGKATLGEIVEKLNDGNFYEKHFQTVAGVKPLYPRNRVWTRRMVEKPLKKLLASGLVARTDGKPPYDWSLTNDGELYGNHGPRTTFEEMNAAWAASAPPFAPDVTDEPNVDPEGGQSQVHENK